MFADSLLDTRAGSHQGWTALASFGLQGIALCCLLLLPLIYTQGLPPMFEVGRIFVPVPPPAPLPATSELRGANQTSQSNMNGIHVVQPRNIPTTIPNIDDHDVPPPADMASNWAQGGPNTTNDPGDIWNSTGSHSSILPTPPPAPPQHHPPISHMMEGNLIYRVQPVYPPAARAARIQGAVVLKAIIGKDGAITNLRVQSGHPFLVKAALDAVSQWRYRPYVLNGETVEVETQVTINFILSGQ
jgi:protein TonB